MKLRKIIDLFETGNVCVVGLKRQGKDMLMANVIHRRKLPYVSNVNYGGAWHRLDFNELDCGKNSYKDFIAGDVRYYEYPYPDRTDIYVSDAGIYTPSHYCNELNRAYPYLPTFMAITGHLYDGNFHVNVQNLGRCWDKIREQSDRYICCKWIFYGGSRRSVFRNIPILNRLVVQRVFIYEFYDSAVKRVPPFRLPRPFFSPERIQQWEIQKQNYDIAHGKVESMLLIYFNRSNYDTRIFKEMLRNGKKKE